jgi:hypothetical protein
MLEFDVLAESMGFPFFFDLEAKSITVTIRQEPKIASHFSRLCNACTPELCTNVWIPPANKS